MNEAVLHRWAQGPCQEDPNPASVGTASALAWFVWRKLETLVLQCVMVNVTSVVDSWGQGSGMWGHKGKLVGLGSSLFTLTDFVPGMTIVVGQPVGPEVVKEERWSASKICSSAQLGCKSLRSLSSSQQFVLGRNSRAVQN